MPPRRARGGRGRGGSSLPVAPPNEEPDQVLENQPAGPSSMAHRDKFNTTPENTQIEEDLMDIDPNDSPATQPTETPASTPIRPPPAVQMEPAGGPGGLAPRGGSRGRAKESKFKPRNIRRSATELQAFADEERDRAAKAAASAARSRGREYAFRGRAGRGRGDAMGRGRGTMSAVASGPFAEVVEMGRRGGFQGTGSGVKRESGISTSRPGAPGGSGGPGGSGLNVKNEGRSIKGGYGGRSYDQDPLYPDEDHSVPRIDIQNINLMSSDEEDDYVAPAPGQRRTGKPPKSNKGGLKPIRLDRHEHKGRASQVTTTPAVKDMPADGTGDPDTPMVDEERSTQVDRGTMKRELKGVLVDGEMQVKDEPAESTNVMDQLEAGEDEGMVDGVPALKERKKPLLKKKGMNFVIQTEEDRGEWERHLEDLEVLKEELGGMQQHTSGKGKAKEDGDGDVDAATDDAEKPVDKKEGRLYLFQFPPVMPKLVNPAKMPKNLGNPASTGDDVQVTGSIDKNVMDLDKVVKGEEEEIIKKEDDEPVKKTRDSLAAEEGYVGKLIVRESGRVELDWGGSRMLVGRGIEASFLSMGVLVDSKGCYDGEGKPTGEGVATGMGKIMGKFVVTPDWESMVEDIDRAERRRK